MLTESDRQSRFWHCFKMELNQTAPSPSRVCMYTHARTHARIHGFDTHHTLTKNTKTNERHVENKNCSTANECRPIKKEEEWQRKKIRWNSFSSERDPFSVTCTHCFVSEKKLAGLFLNWQHLNLLFFPFFFYFTHSGSHIPKWETGKFLRFHGLLCNWPLHTMLWKAGMLYFVIIFKNVKIFFTSLTHLLNI